MFGALEPGVRSLVTLKLVMNVVGEVGRTLNRKEQLRHRALRQHGFLVLPRYARSTAIRNAGMAA